MNKIKLLIYIPTYGERIDNLVHQLETFRVQLPTELIEIIFVVNINEESFEKYENIIETYSRLEIIFKHNAGNIGGNANIALGYVFYGQADYIWILSDDDYVIHRAIPTIAEALAHRPDFLHIGDYDAKDIANQNILINELNFFTVTKGAGFGLISSVIASSSFIKNSLSKAFEYQHSSFPHLAVYLNSIKIHSSAVVRLVKHSDVFAVTNLPSHGTADYSFSIYGFLYLVDFFSPALRTGFISAWFNDAYILFFDLRKKNPEKYEKASAFMIINYPTIFVIGFFKYIRHLLKIFLSHLFRSN